MSFEIFFGPSNTDLTWISMGSKQVLTPAAAVDLTFNRWDLRLSQLLSKVDKDFFMTSYRMVLRKLLQKWKKMAKIGQKWLKKAKKAEKAETIKFTFVMFV